MFARLDRAFRGVADFAVTIEKWMKRGVLIQFVNPQVDLTTAYGMAFAQVAAVFAQLESAIKSERLKEAQARGRERGQKMGRHASFGWKQDGWTTRIVDGVAKCPSWFPTRKSGKRLPGSSNSEQPVTRFPQSPRCWSWRPRFARGGSLGPVPLIRAR